MAASSGHCQDWGSWCKLCVVCHTKTRWTKQYYGYSTHQHTHIFTLCEELSKCSFCLLMFLFPLQQWQIWTNTWGGHSKERERDMGTVGSREEKISLLVLFFCGVNPCAWLTWPSLRVPGTNQSWGGWLKNVVTVAVSTQESPVFHGFAFPPSIWPLFAWIKCQF